jgi:sugar phosphate permease
MQRGTAEIFLALGLILIGIMGLKLTDMNMFWAFIALAGVIGCHGGISVSMRARA